MMAFGLQVRRTREFLGLSQERLAKEAGTSQGAVSRFEGGRGLSTPFLVILRINLALAKELKKLDPALLSEDVRRFLAYMEFLQPPTEVGTQPAAGGTELAALELTDGPEIERLAQLYRGVPRPRRGPFIGAVVELAKALHDRPAGDESTSRSGCDPSPVVTAPPR